MQERLGGHSSPSRSPCLIFGVKAAVTSQNMVVVFCSRCHKWLWTWRLETNPDLFSCSLGVEGPAWASLGWN